MTVQMRAGGDGFGGRAPKVGVPPRPEIGRRAGSSGEKIDIAFKLAVVID
jgi:hypothetical protein